MEKRKVWQFLALLSPENQQSWLGYLQFRFGSRQAYLQQLARYLVNAYPAPPTNETVWKHLYPGTAYDDARLRKLSGDLTHQLEQFLSLQSFDQSPLDQRMQLLNSLLTQHDADLFGKTWKKVCKDVYRLADSAAEIAEYRYRLEVMNREYRVRHRMRDGAFWTPPQETRWGDADTLQRMAYLNTARDLYQMLDLKLNADITYSNTGNRPELPMVEGYVELARSHPVISKLPLMGMYLRLLDLYNSSTPSDPRSLMTFLFRNHQKIPVSERQQVFNWILNYLVVKLNRGESKTVVFQLLDLYEFGINKGLLLHDGVLLPNHYKNMIALCLRAQDLDRAEHFLEDYKRLLPQDVREELPMLNRIHISFAKQDYTRTIQLASQSRFTKSLDELAAREVLLKAHYENGERDPDWLDSQIQSMIRYARNRGNIAPKIKQRAIERFRLYRKLFFASTPEELEAIQNVVKTSSHLDKGRWIASQLHKASTTSQAS